MKTPATPVGEVTSAAPADDQSSTAITIRVEKIGNYIVQLPIASIKIGKRFRSDLGDLDALAASIKEIGLLQPIGVDYQHRLIYGERRLRAHQVLGLENIQARVIAVPSLLAAEHAENEIRKDFTASERVAIAQAIEAEIGNRQGQRTDLKASDHGDSAGDELRKNFSEVGAQALPENFPEVTGKETRNIAAKAAGFGNETTYRQAQKVVEKAEPALVLAMDKGEIAISTAATLASAAPEVQRRAVAQPEQAPKLAKKVVKSPNAGRAMITDRDALAALRPLEGMLSLEDARTLARNYGAALARLVARFPVLAESQEGGDA